MSEHQYYEFRAVDRPLTASQQKELRGLSSRAKITATSFVNEYNYGDFAGDPSQLMELYFDLHIYNANWGGRSFYLRVPSKLADSVAIAPFLVEVDMAQVRTVGDYLIIEISPEESDPDYDEEKHDWLTELSPLRDALMAGDLRMFYLLWLTEVEAETFTDDVLEPLPGIGPITPALSAFAEFFLIDPNLVNAAAERTAPAHDAAPVDARPMIAALTEEERNGFLFRVYEGDPFVGAELRRRVRDQIVARASTPAPAARTVGELRARAEAIAVEKERAAEAKAAAKQAREQREEAAARRKRLLALAARGDSVWRNIEADIDQKIAKTYDQAVKTLADLRYLWDEKGQGAEFARRLAGIHQRHASKRTFIERLRAAGLN